MLILLTIIGIALIALSFAFQRKGMRLTDILLWSVTLWTVGYILSTSFLVLIDQFSITGSSLCVIGLTSVSAIISYFKSSGFKDISIDLNIKCDILPIITAVLAFVLVAFVPYSFFGMGQDEGVYQTEALCYINGMNERQFDYEEYYKLSDLGLQDEYIEQVQTAPNIAGAYPYSDFNNISGVLTGVNRGCISDFSSGFHGLHTFSALLAFWGTLFGIANMNGVNACILALCVLWLFKICRALNLNKIGSSVTIICTLLCPQVLWCAKSALTEPGLTLIWLILIYSFVSREKLSVYLSSLMILAYGCYHVSLYVFMPLYAFIFVALFFYTSDKKYIRTLALSGCAYLYSLCYSLFTACKYTLFNFKPILKAFLTTENIAIFASVASVALILIASIMLIVFRDKNDQKLTSITKAMNSAKGKHIMAWAIRIASLLMFAYIACCFVSHRANTEILTYNTIIAFAYLSGITFFLLSLYTLLVKTSILSNSSSGLVLATMFIYCIIVYSIVFKKDVNYYYYFSRYLTMYIPIIAILAGIAASHCTSSFKSVLDKIKCTTITCASIIGIIILFPHAKFVITNQDDSRYDWDNITSVNNLVESENIEAAFVRPELYTAYYYDLKSIGVDVYPITDNFEAAYDEISSWYDSVIIIDGANPYDYTEDGTCTYESHAAQAGYPVVMTLEDTMTEDLGFYRDARTGLPNGMFSASFDIVVYRYK